MRKLTLLAGCAVLAAAPLGTAAAAAAQPASACVVKYHSYIHLNPKPAYGTLFVTQDSCGVRYHIKILCKTTPTSGHEVYGPTRSAPGKSRANCSGGQVLASAFAVVGGVSHKLYP